MTEEIRDLLFGVSNGVFYRIGCEGVSYIEEEEKKKILEYAKQLREEASEGQISSDDFHIIMEFFYYCHRYSESVEWINDLLEEVYYSFYD